MESVVLNMRVTDSEHGTLRTTKHTSQYRLMLVSTVSAVWLSSLNVFDLFLICCYSKHLQPERDVEPLSLTQRSLTVQPKNRLSKAQLKALQKKSVSPELSDSDQSDSSMDVSRSSQWYPFLRKVFLSRKHSFFCGVRAIDARKIPG